MDRWINKRSGEVQGRGLQKSRIQERMRFPYGFEIETVNNNEVARCQERDIRNQEYRRACVFYGFDMDRWINKRSGEVKGRKHQKSRIQESMRFPMVMTWTGGYTNEVGRCKEGNIRNQEFRRACAFLWF